MHHILTPCANKHRSARSLTWTPQGDARLSRMVLEGASIRALALAFGIGRQAAQQRAKKLGLLNASERRSLKRCTMSNVATDLANLTRDSLPAGHELTWGLINLGTCLEGASYPAPEAVGLSRKLLASVAVAG